VSDTSESNGGNLNSSGAPSSREGAHVHMNRSPIDMIHYGSQFPYMQQDPQPNLDLEARVRFEQQRAALQGEVASAKQRYVKKLSALERQLEQARSEKRDLQN